MGSIKNVKQYYRNQKKEEAVRIHPPSKNILQIILIRHGEPDVEMKKIYNRSQMVEYDYMYYHSMVKVFDRSPIDTSALPVDKIYHSSLRRAAHTAEILFGEKAVLIADSRFREFERDVIKDVRLYLPLKFWKIISRLQWFLGYSSPKVESVKLAKQRSKANASFLSEKAATERIVILVAHGLHNRYVVRYLKKMGWTKIYSSGYKFLGIQILGKEEQ